MEIMLMYFDGCPNWRVTADRLAVIAAERPDLEVVHRSVPTLEDAEATRFRGSPSVLIDGVDLFPDPHAQIGLSCRLYDTPAGLAGAPTVDQLRAAISAAERSVRGPDPRAPRGPTEP